MLNALSFDLEDWYMVRNFSKFYSFDDWKNLPSRIEKNTNKILGILNSNNTRATFFTLGYVAEKYPELIKKIYDNGHEIACHTYKHDLVYNLSKEEFDSDIKKCKKIINKIIKTRIIGFRAPSFSITNKNLWAFDILKNNSFVYDSSIFPIKHPEYGIKNFK
ncbi:polysaccharide deacetylase family protein, partial [Candidatus Woesearchaeota archaeon]|nr:polysaccharide deacetylase family protein [Candidatus Woesearchaeota archaeon]